MSSHSYVDRRSNRLMSEPLYGDLVLRFLYSTTREKAPSFFDLVTGSRLSTLIGYLHFDQPLSSRLLGSKFVRSRSTDFSECVSPREALDTPRKIFERKIRYWECRPMPQAPDVVVSPADAKVVIGSFESSSLLFLKEKFFDFAELLEPTKSIWHHAFHRGDFAVFRLTPDKYHYNHTPVAGRVLDFYPVKGEYHSCNPHAVVDVVTPYSKNKRVVTIIDTDAAGGTGVGLVAMVEVVALGIGDIVQCYSHDKYCAPQGIEVGMWLDRGLPKSLFRPGSSTVVLVFQRGRVKFAQDIVANLFRNNAYSVYSIGFGKPLVETDVQVRSAVASSRRPRPPQGLCPQPATQK